MDSVMFIDPSDFPVVRLDFNRSDPEERNSFSVFEELLSRARPFLFIGSSEGEHEHGEDPAERKRAALWVKAHREQLRRLVLAVIFVEPSASKRLVLTATANFSEQFWGYPMRVAASEQAALTMAEALLAGKPAADIHNDRVVL